MAGKIKVDESERLHIITEYERPLWARGLLVSGVDEVGRGPLAGPVIAACVILPPQPLIEFVNDSKKLSEKKRDMLNDKILELATAVGFGVSDEQLIDRVNIKNATLLAMADAVKQAAPEFILCDNERIDTDIPQSAIVHGDAVSYLIGAASIIAKVKRDALMVKLHEEFPVYGFARNKGYGTKEHIEAIKKHGLCKYHRRSFTGNFVTET